MGASLVCCPATPEGNRFKDFCISHASPEFKGYLAQLFQGNILQYGDFIVGDWGKSSHKTGKGIIYSPENFYFEGDIVDSKAQGTGRIIWSNKAIYRGSIINNQANGEGQLMFEDQELTLKGIWQNGDPCKNSKFQMTRKNQKEQITIIDMKPTEDSLTKTQSQVLIIKVKFGQGALYEGEAKRKNNSLFKIQGYGKLSFADGSEYAGQFKDGKMHGHGKYFWASNKHWYEGQYKYNYRDGQGTYYYSNQNYKKGIWKGGHLASEVSQ